MSDRILNLTIENMEYIIAAQSEALEKAEAALLAVQRHLEPKGFAFWCYWCHEGNIWSRHHSADCPLEPALAAIEGVKEATK